MPESFEWLERRHFELQQQQRSDDQRRSDYLLNQVNDFVQKLSAAGADIRDAERRTQLQKWLSHWKDFVFERTGKVPSAELDRPPFPLWPILIGAILVLVLVALAAFIRFVVFTPSVPEVRIIALGGGAVLPGEALGFRPPAGAKAASLEGEIGINPPIDPGTVLLDDFAVIRASAQGRMVLLDDVSNITASGQTDTTAIAIRAVAEDDQSIETIEVYIDDQPTISIGGSIPPKAPVTHYTQDLCLIINPWGSDAFKAGSISLRPGPHTIKIIARNSDGVQGASDEINLQVVYKSSDSRLWKAVTSVEPCEAGLFSVASPLPSAVNTPLPPFTPTPTPTRPPVTVTVTPTPIYPCRDNSAFVADVTVPDGTVFDPGVSFNKTWRLRNTGTCTWNTRYQLVHVGGAQLGTTNAVNLPHDVPPGGEVDITVPMVAPDRVGEYRSHWQMRNPDCGNLFGVTVHADIVVHPGAGNLPMISRFEVVPQAISPGQQATIYWAYVNGTSARLQPGDQAIGPTGSQVVAPNATTNYRLVVTNAAGSVERTITLVVQPGPIPGPPPASPAHLTITAVRRDGFDFTWTDTSLDEQGFRLYNFDTRQAVASFPANITSGAIAGLDCGRPYNFYLVSFNERGESLPSNSVPASTSACDG